MTSFQHCIETSPWVPEDALFQVLQWQNMRVPTIPSTMTMTLRFVRSSINSLSKYCSMWHSLYYLCIRPVQAWIEVLFELKQLTGKYSVDRKVESFVKLVAYDVEWVDNTDWRELEHWISHWRKAVMSSQPIIQITLAVKVHDSGSFNLCTKIEVFEVIYQDPDEIRGRLYNYLSYHSTLGSISFQKSMWW